MRRAIQSVVWAGLLAIGGVTGLGTSTAQAQGYGGYLGGGVVGGYPINSYYGPGSGAGYGSYGRGYNTLGGGIGVGVNVYSASRVGGYPGYGAVNYGYPQHHHHRHHRGCGHHGY